jgi:hypothetical protein
MRYPNVRRIDLKDSPEVCHGEDEMLSNLMCGIRGDGKMYSPGWRMQLELGPSDLLKYGGRPGASANLLMDRKVEVFLIIHTRQGALEGDRAKQGPKDF